MKTVEMTDSEWIEYLSIKELLDSSEIKPETNYASLYWSNFSRMFIILKNAKRTGVLRYQNGREVPEERHKELEFVQSVRYVPLKKK